MYVNTLRLIGPFPFSLYISYTCVTVALMSLVGPTMVMRKPRADPGF